MTRKINIHRPLNEIFYRTMNCHRWKHKNELTKFGHELWGWGEWPEWELINGCPSIRQCGQRSHRHSNASVIWETCDTYGCSYSITASNIGTSSFAFEVIRRSDPDRECLTKWFLPWDESSCTNTHAAICAHSTRQSLAPTTFRVHMRAKWNLRDVIRSLILHTNFARLLLSTISAENYANSTSFHCFVRYLQHEGLPLSCPTI